MNEVNKVPYVLNSSSTMTPLLHHLPTEAKRTASTSGGEYAGPCPRCGGEDRFRVWPEHPRSESGRFFCRRCDWSGDGIDLLRSDVGGAHSFAEACLAFGLRHKIKPTSGDGAAPFPERTPSRKGPVESHSKPPNLLRPPGEAWQKKAGAFVGECQRRLWKDTRAATSALRYLRDRGLREETIRTAGLGLNPSDRWPLRTSWGLEPREEKRDGGRIWLPRGIVIPWWKIGGGLWKFRVRRPSGDVAKNGGPKYVQAAAVRPGSDGKPEWSSNALYGAHALRAGRPAVLVEGAFDALAITQEARTQVPFPKGRPLVAAVACSTSGARRPHWIAKLATARPVLVAFDADENGAGEEASQYWVNILPNAVRHAPSSGSNDPAEMLEKGEDVRAWVEEGLFSRCDLDYEIDELGYKPACKKRNGTRLTLRVEGIERVTRGIKGFALSPHVNTLE